MSLAARLSASALAQAWSHMHVGNGWSVVAHDLSLVTNQRRLLEAADFTLLPGTKAALIGRNGGGKTSLLSLLCRSIRGEAPPRHLEVAGHLQVSPGVRVALLPQEARANGLSTVGGYLEREASWTSGGEHERVLAELRVEPQWHVRPVASLSGGEATRVVLAATLLADADLLLLDEPTNNLDFEGQRVVAAWIRRTRAAVLVVSHDRDLLTHAVDEIWEIDEHELGLIRYGLGYQGYVAQKRLQFEASVRLYQEQERRRQELERSARRLSLRATSYERLSTDSTARRKARKIARVASSQRVRVERELTGLGEPRPPARPRLLVKPAPDAQGTVITVSNCRIGFPGATPLIKSLTLRLRAGRRYGLVGPNGCGKSTFLDLLMGAIAPVSGQVERAPELGIVMLRQTPLVDDPRQHLVDRVRSTAAISLEEAGAVAGMALMRECATTRVGQLSVGELRRIDLATTFAAGAGLLLLDEPSNHLDVPTLDMVDEALSAYCGTAVIVSHDRRLLEGAGLDELWMIMGQELTRWDLYGRSLSEVLEGLRW